MIPPDEFWGTNYYGNPPLTAEAAAEAEKRLGVVLPPEYIHLLRIQNGGYTSGLAYPMQTPTSWADDHVPCDELAGIVIDEDHDSMHNVLRSASMAAEWQLPPDQVLLAGDGHWWTTLDYRRSTIPTVTWLDVEIGEDIVVAPTFRAFLDGLVPASQFEADPDELPIAGGTFQWQPERIEITLEDAQPSAPSRPSLVLRFGLDPGMHGLTMSRLYLPPYWVVASAVIAGEALLITLADGQVFKITGENWGLLNLAVIESSLKSAEALEQAWRRHAGV